MQWRLVYRDSGHEDDTWVSYRTGDGPVSDFAHEKHVWVTKRLHGLWPNRNFEVEIQTRHLERGKKVPPGPWQPILSLENT